MRGRRLGLAGHAAFEFISVITRVPPPLRLRRLGRTHHHRDLSGDHVSICQPAECLRRLPGLGITGGAVYDALVAEVARVCGVPFVTDDRLVLGTYASIGCTPQLLT